MSLIVAVYVPTGVVLSGDSRTTGTIQQQTQQAPGDQPALVQTNIVISDAAEKVFLAFKRFGVGAFGAALIDALPIAHYVEQFELKAANPPATTVDCATALMVYFQALQPVPEIGLIVCGYDGNDPHVYGVDVKNQAISRANIVQGSNPPKFDYGIVRGGDTAVADRLLSQPQFNPLFSAMNIQDAVDYSRHLIRSTIDQLRFEPRFATVGGAIDTVVVTPKEARFLVKKDLH